MLKLALPKGRLQPATGAYLEKAGWGLTDYELGSRSYRPTANFPGAEVKVFQEKDIPVQVAIGNYDLGVCGTDWVEELLARYPQSPLVKVKELGYGQGHLYLASSRLSPWGSVADLRGNGTPLRLAGEYPHLAGRAAMRLRLKRFRVYPLWGAVEVYPPESADLVTAHAASPTQLEERGLVPLLPLCLTTACLIANQDSWQDKGMAGAISSLLATPPQGDAAPEPPAVSLDWLSRFDGDWLRLALPDGHQKEPAVDFLRRAGLEVVGYASGKGRPDMGVEGLAAKVIRPQDMPLQVACGNFDLAITGQDWLRDHLYQFPSSPVEPLLELGFGWVRVVAVVSGQVPVSSPAELRGLLEKGQMTGLRVATEYVNIADRFARDHHLGRYRIIPTWGATEAFLPEDADLLIENTQTGQTLARHGLKIIDVLFESTACVIGSRDIAPQLREQRDALLQRLAGAVG
ncbi:MAG: ATP phosphoribosyltransferase [Dehalococcoidia bacterium]